MGKIVACIMAGGIGSRFWPASTAQHPKQFLDIMGLGRSLLQLTYDRYITIGLAPEDIFVVTSQNYVKLVQEHLPDLGLHQIIGEPERRNTAPAAYVGNRLIQHLHGDAVVVMAPSDHLIEEVTTFGDIIKEGYSLVSTEPAIITIGIEPHFAHTGYGYIEYQDFGRRPYKVGSFTEKPDTETAKGFLAAGNHLWNAGIFMWRTSALIDAFEQHSPDIKQAIDDNLLIDNNGITPKSLSNIYSAVRSGSIDYEIMERAQNIFTIPAPAKMNWSDLGSWKSLYDESDKDQENNVIVAEKSHMVDSTKNLIFAPGKKVIVKGLQNYMILEKNDALVICPIADDQTIKKWREEMLGDE